MTPREAAQEFWRINGLCKDNPSDKRLLHGRIDALGKAQNKFDAYQWTEYSEHHKRISDEIYGPLVRPHEQ